MSPKIFLLRNTFPHQCCYSSITRAPSVPVACGCIPCAPQARPPAPCSVRLLTCRIHCKIATSRGNNHRSCLAASLCKLSCRSFRADHEGLDQAQPRPRQPPVARAVRGHQDTREPGSRSEKFSAESRPLGETITDPVSQPHYASCLAGPLERITEAQIKPSHALGIPLWRARQQQT